MYVYLFGDGKEREEPNACLPVCNMVVFGGKGSPPTLNNIFFYNETALTVERIINSNVS